MLPAGPYPIHFSMLSPKMMSVLVHEQALGKPAHFYGPKKRYFCRFLLFLLFWTISPTRIGLLIWLGAYFKAETLGHTSCPLAGLCVPFWVHLGVPKCPKKHRKTIFWLFWTISLTRMGLLIQLGVYFQDKTFCHTSHLLAGLCVPFWVHFGCPNAPKQHKETIFWLFWTIYLTLN